MEVQDAYVKQRTRGDEKVELATRPTFSVYKPVII